MSQETKHQRGIWGEDQVATYLEEKGHQILQRRWRCRFGEIDLITAHGPYLCFVEVKLRKNDDLAPARAFVTASKQKKIRIAAQLYLSQNPTPLQPRLDVAEIYAAKGRNTLAPRIIYWENAF